MVYRTWPLIVLYVFSMLLVLMQRPVIALQREPIPQYEGDDNPQHDGQPKFCLNHDTAKHAKNCSCRSMNPDGESCSQEKPSCKVYCRPKSCQCLSPCTT